MKILYIHQYFKTPQEPGGTRSYWISKELIKHGHQVTMLTTSNTISTKIHRTKIDGIDVIYLKVPYDNAMGIIKRLLSFLKFMVKSTIMAWKQQADLVIATSTPLTVGFPALVLKKFKDIPYFFEVRDLWPEVPIQMGAINNPVIKWAANSFEKKVYKNAEHIIALSPGMADGVEAKGIAQSKVSVIPNMAKIDEFWPRESGNVFTTQMGIKGDSFKVIHFGSMGIANGLDYIIDCAKLLHNKPDIEFIFIGSGATESGLKKRCLNEGLTNVHFLGKFPMDKTSEIVNACDVSVVTFLNIPILNTNSPNKLFDSLSAGKPIIVNSNGWTKTLVEKYNCGLYVNPDEPKDLADKILYLVNTPVIAKTMGENARKLAENEYDKSILCKQYADVLNKHFNN